MTEAKRHSAEWNYVSYADRLKSLPVLVLETNDRNIADHKAMSDAPRAAGNTRVTEKHMETDHSFVDHRIALQVALLQWLAPLSSPASK